jgi:uncharacterized protein (DUF1330 family)
MNKGMPMSYEAVIGLEIENNESYTKYRDAMTPLLESFGGGFRYDFVVSEVLKAQNQEKINRVFTIHFPSKEKMDEFFALPEYKEIRRTHFKPAVASSTFISQYER